MTNPVKPTEISAPAAVPASSPAVDLDQLDKRIVAVLRSRPRIPVVELARTLGVARGTAHARLRRLEQSNVVTGYGPDIDLDRAGWSVLSFTTLEIIQESDRQIVGLLESMPEVLEVFAVTGPGDLLCRIVARSNAHLHEILQRVLGQPGVIRATTNLALATRIHRTGADLLAASANSMA